MNSANFPNPGLQVRRKVVALALRHPGCTVGQDTTVNTPALPLRCRGYVRRI